MPTQTKYTYAISTDTANGKADTTKLISAIRNSSIVIAADYINTSGDVLDVWMKDVLSTSAPDDVTNLNNVVSAHDGEPLSENLPQITDDIEENLSSTSTYQFCSVIIDAANIDEWNTVNQSWPFDVYLYSSQFKTKSDSLEDKIRVWVAKDTQIGFINVAVSASDTVIRVDDNVMANIKIGYLVKLDDGTNADECGRCTDIDRINNTITIETATVNAFTVASPTTEVKITREMGVSSPIDNDMKLVMGASKKRWKFDTCK